MNRKITNYALRKAAEHLYYEAWMFYQTLVLLRQPRHQIEVNILLDAFVVHTRNLFDFFYPKEHLKPDDMVVADYLLKPKVFNAGKIKKSELLFIVRKADKQLAHLTYARNRYNQKTKPWPFVDIGRKMHKTLSSFYDALPSSYRKWSYIIKLKTVIDTYAAI